METPRRRRRYHRRHHGMRASGGGMGIKEMLIAVGTSGFGFLAADALDRFLATYDPTAAEKPKDKFTSDGAGTLANTLNVASRPGLIRIGAGIGMVAVPVTGAVLVRNSYARAAFEGIAIGAGINLLKTFWSSFLMPLFIGKDTTTPVLQKSYIARLYPAEVAASINMQQKQTAVSAAGAGALSGAPAAGVGAPADVGPFALAAESPYPDAAQALRREAGVHDQLPSLQNVWGTGGPGSDYPTAAQAMGTGAPAGHGYPAQPGMGEAYMPGPPPGPGPGPQAAPHKDSDCGCVGDDTMRFSAFLGDAAEESSSTA